MPERDAESRTRHGIGVIRGGRVLDADGTVRQRDLAWQDGRLVDHVDGAVDLELDATDRWVLPGIVDLHGDAFERCLMPRPGVRVPLEMAMADNDAQLLTSGITTSYLSVTDSWEPGLRSRATLAALVELLDHHQSPVDLRLHVRHEQCLTDGHAVLTGWIRGGTIDLLSINDHTPERAEDAAPERIAAVMTGRAGVPAEEFSMLMVAAMTRRDEGRHQIGELVEQAAAAGVPVASHDALDRRQLDDDVALGVGIAEFPATEDLAAAYRRHGIAVVLGAPNVVRGGSHIDNLGALDAVEGDVVDALCSDYHYPSLLQAPFTLAHQGVRELPAAWSLVSARPAAAARLHDRGSLIEGQRADVIVVDDQGTGAAVDHVVVAGQVVLRRA